MTGPEMKCRECNFKTENKKSLSNHIRWHLGLMNKESYFGINKQEKNGMWKGNEVGYASIHEWSRLHKKKPPDGCVENVICKLTVE
jgi:hypothetical protein